MCAPTGPKSAPITVSLRLFLWEKQVRIYTGAPYRPARTTDLRQGRRLSLLSLSQMKHDAAIRQSQLIHRREALAESIAERGFSDVGIDGAPATQQLLKLRVRWRDPFDNEVSCCQVAA